MSVSTIFIPASVRIHSTAIVESGVKIGAGSAIWDNVHIRASSLLGEQCIVGEKTYIAPGVQIGNRVKINAFVYVCNGVTLEDGVMISAGVIFTNDRFPRATSPDLRELRTSDPDNWSRQHRGVRLNHWTLRYGGHGVGSDQISTRLCPDDRRSGPLRGIRLPLRRADASLPSSAEA